MVKKIISLILTILILLVSGVTIYKLINRHNQKLYDVLYSEIEYMANRCYLEKKCGTTMILSELYDKGYLDIQYDPVTKEELDKDIRVEINGNVINILKDSEVINLN